jgi:hypothetical protein
MIKLDRQSGKVPDAASARYEIRNSKFEIRKSQSPTAWDLRRSRRD